MYGKRSDILSLLESSETSKCPLHRGSWKTWQLAKANIDILFLISCHEHVKTETMDY